MPARDEIIKKIFAAQDENGFWKLLPRKDPNFSTHLHYSPNFRSTLWTLVLLADLRVDPKEERVRNGTWKLEHQVRNLVTTIGSINKSNPFITERAVEVLQ